MRMRRSVVLPARISTLDDGIDVLVVVLHASVSEQRGRLGFTLEVCSPFTSRSAEQPASKVRFMYGAA